MEGFLPSVFRFCLRTPFGIADFALYFVNLNELSVKIHDAFLKLLVERFESIV